MRYLYTPAGTVRRNHSVEGPQGNNFFAAARDATLAARVPVACFKLAGYTVVEYVDREGCEELDANGYALLEDDGTVSIGYNPALSAEHLARVQYHEWLHAIWMVVGIPEGEPFTHAVLDLVALNLAQISATYQSIPEYDEEPPKKPRRQSKPSKPKSKPKTPKKGRK